MRELALLLLVIALASSCSSSSDRKYGPDLLRLKPAKITPLPIVDMFSKVCLGSELQPEDYIARATALGFEDANDTELNNNGLKALKKRILQVPGGGARIEETQSIYKLVSEDGIAVLSLEERFAAKRKVASSCTVFKKQADLLEVCTQVGTVIDRAPNSNRKYKNSGSHFISWNTRIGSRRAVINCLRSPRATLLPFDGVSVGLRIDHSTKVKKTVSNNANIVDR